MPGIFAAQSFADGLVTFLGAVIGLVVFLGPAAYLIALVFRYRSLTAAKQRERDADRGICPHCGYDNRSSGQVCSECGKRNPIHWKRELAELEKREGEHDEGDHAA